MRVFVVGTGRCGTCTFYQVVKNTVTNFTCGHETVYWSKQSRVSLRYNDNHIEVGHTLNPIISLLVDSYPEAKFIHLQRDRESCLESLKKNGLGTLRPFSRWAGGVNHSLEYVLYYDSVNSLLRRVLPSDRTRHIWLHQVRTEWASIWDWLQLEGDFEKSISMWNLKYNYQGTGRDSCESL